MGYLHINNLYKDQRILLFHECYALEKIHGTSAHIGWRDGALRFFSGGEEFSRFVGLFSLGGLTEAFKTLGYPEVTVYGEAYGGKQQGQRDRYGDSLRFVAFDVKIGDTWLAVPNAHDVAIKLGLEFVYYEKVATSLPVLNAQRDAPSEQARRNGIVGDKPREGVVLRPLVETFTSNGERVIAKHKRDEERETKTPRTVDASKAEVLRAANDIAEEWVTPTRLTHVLDKLAGDADIERTREVIAAMTEDVLREAAGEIVDSREARVAIGKKTAMLFKGYLKARLTQ